ncbi:thioredoxin family protein [Shimia sagamensis]|uniref:Thioredoxin n=1 Tax=Shimia sagamensis TaxID=1566352 RepID=A0ABY1N9P1_9RHOB|nr:thioredoxin family protein [Shimia sagamensis]SMP04218.1 Thioredoxin [Shimia sagamensis]
MHRRTFLASASATLVLPMAARASINYTPGLVKKHLAAGDTVFLDFKTDWCTTCAAQERAINALKQSNPAYDEAITFINVDWDQHSNSELARTLKIPRRSTLVALKGDQELGRIVAGTSKSKIKDLLDTALTAATD